MKVQEALFLIMGQDHRSIAGQHTFRGGKGRAYYGGEEEYDDVDHYDIDEEDYPAAAEDVYYGGDEEPP